MRYIALLMVLLSFQLAAQTQTIKEPAYRYKCPKDWTPMRYQGVLVVTSPLENSNDKFADNLNILSQPAKLFRDVSLEEYVKVNIREMEAAGITNIQRSEYLAGKKKLKGILLVYTTDNYSKGTYQQKLWQVFVKYNKKYFVISYSSLPQTYAKYLPQIEQIVSTIVFK